MPLARNSKVVLPIGVFSINIPVAACKISPNAACLKFIFLLLFDSKYAKKRIVTIPIIPVNLSMANSFLNIIQAHRNVSLRNVGTVIIILC